MDVTDTKPLEKCCSRCEKNKTYDKFIPNRNICKECRNERGREKYKALVINSTLTEFCNSCNKEKSTACFIKNRKICRDCNNEKRRTKRLEDEAHRKHMNEVARVKKHKKVLENRKKKEDEIGKENKKCSSCNQIKHMSCFRYNRLKCKICERDDPLDKFKRVVRTRIYNALKCKNKSTVEYLGCTKEDYLKWILSVNQNYTLDNHGKEWHIDHVMPLSKFNLDEQEQQKLAFNWRNTTPLSVKDNLSKNKKIIKSQIEQHYKNLVSYHEENSIELPQIYIDLFAT